MKFPANTLHTLITEQDKGGGEASTSESTPGGWIHKSENITIKELSKKELI